MHATENRKLMIGKLVETFKKVQLDHDSEIDEKKLIALMSYEHGTSERTAKEYIRSAKAVLDGGN